MKRYRFPLAGVLRVRRIEEDRAVVALAEAERARAAALEHAARKEADHRAAAARQSPAAASAFLARRETLARSASAVRSSHDAVAAAETATLARRAAVAAASAAVSALEHLDERRRAEHELEVRREEAIEVDDLVTGRFRRDDR